MKLRLKGNSVRVRMSQSEVQKLAETGLVEEVVEFMPNPLVYVVHLSQSCRHIEVSYSNGWITVILPEQPAKEWAIGDKTGMEGDFRGISLLIEKDWACLHADEAENEDTFPRPSA